MKKHNFYAGPAILPQQVLKQASNAIDHFNNSGLSLIEISHRSKDWMQVMDEARSLVKELMGLNDDYAVLFLQGGASTQFYTVPYNLAPEGSTLSYIDTGTWASKAIKEAKLFANVDVVASSKDKNFSYIPDDITPTNGSAYLHLTSNNTISGTQMHNYKDYGVSTVIDMSSDLFCRDLDFSQFDLIYAGAQKNLGPAGTTVVVVKKDILGKTGRTIPSMIDYNTHIGKDSMYNTPPVFAIYVCYLTMKWIKELGGLDAMEKRNNEKADLLYNAIDSSSIFKGTAREKDRSIMNVTFVPMDDSITDDFVSFCTENEIVGIKGHRSVGGFRASIYNAMELSSVQHLVDVMKEFERKA